MKNNRTLIVIICICFLSLTFFTGCGNKENSENPDLSQTETQDNGQKNNSLESASETNLYGEKSIAEIKEDLTGSSFIEENIGTDESYSITDISLIKRNTLETTDDVYCTVVVNSDNVSISQDYELIYNYYSTGGWILDVYTATGEKTVLPLKGVDDALVNAAMTEEMEYDYDYQIGEHYTDLESMSDRVSVSVSKNGGIFRTSGTLFLYYQFNGGFWELTNVEKSEDYNEYWDIEGTWVLNQPEYDKITIIQLWRSSDMVLHGNYYRCFYSDGVENLEFYYEYENTDITINIRLNSMSFDGMVCRIDYNNIYEYGGYEDDTTPAFQKVSSDIISRNDFATLITQ